ncbi:MAG: asparagine synthase (glutamine-hydrolyzing) [Flavobacteriales bacterium]|jgi:asparagine synthase (glutamine-hydrolysing)
MCGIAGVWHKSTEVNQADTTFLKKALYHRGPDVQAFKYFNNKKGVLVHTRLSIIDLSEAANQPFLSDDGRYTLVFNGEIFNYLELREELKQLGVNFATESDTEVLLKAYQNWGEACLHKFNGMWAFCIWDEEEQSLFLARDRFGIKPLYFIDDDNFFAFASETVAFNELSFFKKEFDEQNVALALADPDKLEGLGKCIYQNIYQLMPGHTLKFTHDKGILTSRWYNLFDHKSPYKGTYDEALTKFKDLFFDACKLRLRSDVPTATALSGGVDSSAVYCTIQEILKQNAIIEQDSSLRKAFTAAFKGMPQDESELAASTVKEKGGQHFLSEDNVDEVENDLKQSVKAIDTISAISILSLQNVYGAMKKQGITVSMDGHGADELLYGYRHQISHLFYETLRKSTSKNTPLTLAKVLGGMKESSSKEDYLGMVDEKFNGVKNSIRNFLKKDEELKDNMQLKYGDRYEFGGLSFLEKDLYRDFLEYTLPNILRNFDRASMTHAVEIRMPFMDYRLVEFLFSLPFDFKIRAQGKTKQILRDAMQGIVPVNILERTIKIGVGTPTNVYLKNIRWANYAYQQLKQRKHE